MKITIAVDSFKGSMTSLEAGTAIRTGIELKNTSNSIAYAKQAHSHQKEQSDTECNESLTDITLIPVADGGEGTLEALTFGKKATKVEATVTGPLGDKHLAKYVIINDDTAIIEIAEAAGLTLVPESLRNPLNTTTYGVGELIKHAIDIGCRKFIIGLGGSATNDCGIGMLRALGFDFLNNDLKNVGYGANALKDIAHISYDNVLSDIYQCDFQIICDVDNPLVGERGCSRIFAPQKGATLDMVEHMDSWMCKFSDLVEQNITTTLAHNRFTPGTGAAGGLGYAFLMFLNGKLLPGADIVIRETGLEEHIKASDLVIVGEGKMDSQSTMGKIPYAIAKLAKKYDKKVIAFAGITEDEELLYKTGLFDAIYTVDRNDMSIEEAMVTENAINNLTQTAKNVL